jgi:hypothetical protein
LFQIFSLELAVNTDNYLICLVCKHEKTGLALAFARDSAVRVVIQYGLSVCVCVCVWIHGVSKRFGEWYEKTKKKEDTNKLTVLDFKMIPILHNTLLATFIKASGNCQERPL